MKVWIAFIVLGISISLAADCPNPAPECQTCLDVEGCGWCAPTQTCMKGDKTGPTEQGIVCNFGWFFDNPGESSCEVCESIGAGSCTTCEALPQCEWTEDGCKAVGHKPQIPCPCEQYSACSLCVAHYRPGYAECQWCPTSQSCVNGQESECKTVTECPCNSFQSCRACKTNSACAWCPLSNSEGCFDKESVPNKCSVTLDCNTVCNNYKSCSECNGVTSTCGWCPKQNTCVSLEEDHGCQVEFKCSPADGDTSDPKRKFDGGVFVGGMFLAVGLMGIVGLGYWYTTRRTYSALN